jgi:hypothetical protein
MAAGPNRQHLGEMPSPCRLTFVALLAGACSVVGCSSPKTCPQTGCQPAITLAYRQPIAGDYMIAIELQNVVYQASCPRGMSGPGTSDAAIAEITCDANGAVLHSVDLGHTDNETEETIVQLNIDETVTMYMVTVSLVAVTNSTNCELLCTQHTGSVGN